MSRGQHRTTMSKAERGGKRYLYTVWKRRTRPSKQRSQFRPSIATSRLVVHDVVLGSRTADETKSCDFTQHVRMLCHGSFWMQQKLKPFTGVPSCHVCWLQPARSWSRSCVRGQLWDESSGGGSFPTQMASSMLLLFLLFVSL